MIKKVEYEKGEKQAVIDENLALGLFLIESRVTKIKNSKKRKRVLIFSDIEPEPEVIPPTETEILQAKVQELEDRIIALDPKSKDEEPPVVVEGE